MSKSNLPVPAPLHAEESITILDESDPISIINLLPAAIKERVKIAAMKAPQLFTMGEEAFLAHAKSQIVHFDTTDEMIRDQFWIEYHHARAANTMINAVRVMAGAISKEGFYDHYMRNTWKVAWMLTMPLQYSRVLKRNLTQLARNMSDLINKPLTDPETGKFDKSLAQMQIALLKFHEVTLHGTPTQRIEQKSMTYNVTRHEGSMAQGAIEGGNTESVMERIKRLEALERQASHVPKLAEWQTMPVTGVDLNKKINGGTE